MPKLQDSPGGSPGAFEHVIVTPVWQTRPDDLSIRLLEHSYAVNSNVPILFVGPDGLDIGFYRERFPRAWWHAFAPEHFSSVTSYSTWMTSPELYEAVSAYKFMTMCQQDAILLRPVTQVPMGDTDYIGAPWSPPVRVLRIGHRISVASHLGEMQGPWWTQLLGTSIRVGNGGLSTRRISTMIEVARALGAAYPDSVRHGLLEDVYFCALGPQVGLRITDETTAGRTYVESTADQHSLPGELVGLHGAHKWNPTLLAHVLGT